MNNQESEFLRRVAAQEELRKATKQGHPPQVKSSVESIEEQERRIAQAKKHPDYLATEALVHDPLLNDALYEYWKKFGGTIQVEKKRGILGLTTRSVVEKVPYSPSYNSNGQLIKGKNHLVNARFDVFLNLGRKILENSYLGYSETRYLSISFIWNGEEKTVEILSGGDEKNDPIKKRVVIPQGLGIRFGDDTRSYHSSKISEIPLFDSTDKLYDFLAQQYQARPQDPDPRVIREEPPILTSG